MLMVEDLLKLKEQWSYYKHLPAYLSNWQITPGSSILNYDTRVGTEIHISEEKISLQC